MEADADNEPASDIEKAASFTKELEVTRTTITQSVGYILRTQCRRWDTAVCKARTLSTGIYTSTACSLDYTLPHL